MDIFKILQEELQIGYKQVEAAVQLIDEGNTIPFIARYRKEATGSLNDEVLRNLDERLRYLRNLDEKKEQVLSTIRDQEKLTPELEKQIQAAASWASGCVTICFPSSCSSARTTPAFSATPPLMAIGPRNPIRLPNPATRFATDW